MFQRVCKKNYKAAISKGRGTNAGWGNLNGKRQG